MSTLASCSQDPEPRTSDEARPPSPETPTQDPRGRGPLLHSSSTAIRERRIALSYILEGHLTLDYDPGLDHFHPWTREAVPPPAVHIHRVGRNPEMSPYYVAELAFQLVDESLAPGVGDAARRFIRGGFRRVFGIFLHEGEVREWSPSHDAWLGLDLDGTLVDQAFAMPVPIVSLLAPTRDDLSEAASRTLQRHRARMAQEDAERAERAEWVLRWRQACISVIHGFCAHLGITPSPRVRARIEELDAQQLTRLFADLLCTRALPRWITRRRSRSRDPS